MTAQWMMKGDMRHGLRKILRIEADNDKTRVCHLIRQKWSPDGLHFVVSMQFFQYLSAL